VCVSDAADGVTQLIAAAALSDNSSEQSKLRITVHSLIPQRCVSYAVVVDNSS
jgi:hypothetical protein